MDEKTAPKKLTPKQERFCEEYTFDFNAAAAARRSGYSEKSARDIGYENLSKPEIQACLARLRQAVSERANLTVDRLLEELAGIGFANMRDYIDGENLPVSIAGLPRELSAAVKSVKHRKRVYYDSNGKPVTVESRELVLHDKLEALYRIGQHLGMWDKGQGANMTDRVESVKIEIVGMDKMERLMRLAGREEVAGSAMAKPEPDQAL